jgi:PilZ domain
MMSQPDIDRRSSPRVAVDYTVFYDYSVGNRPKTKLLDVSIEGAGLEALNPADVGTVTSFVFVTHGFQAIPCQAEVCSIRPLNDGKYRLGVRFLRLSDEGKQLVTQVIQSAAGGD